VVSSLFLLAGAAAVSLCGCGAWEEVTSREFTIKGMFVKPDPLHVLEKDKDGDHRQLALRQLKEPKQNNGTDEEQTAYVRILVTAAATESQPLARLAAIQTMATYKDPRVVEGLKDAYYKATSFPPETNTMLKCAALTGLGQTGHPAAVQTLVDALKEPPIAGPDVDRQHKMDERIAAARALGHFKQYKATEALVAVLRKDKDVALRDCVHHSLVLATGKELPPDARAWDEFMNQKQPDSAVAKTPGQKISEWFSQVGWPGK
jgi:HEAT repeat protein